MQSKSEAKNSGSNKLWIALFIFAATIYLADFLFYGQRIHDIAAAFGFALAAFGTWKSNQIALNSGGVIAVAAIASKYLL